MVSPDGELTVERFRPAPDPSWGLHLIDVLRDQAGAHEAREPIVV